MEKKLILTPYDKFVQTNSTKTTNMTKGSSRRVVGLVLQNNERITHDFDQIQNIIKSIGVDNEIVPLKVIRLGRYQISPSRISISSDRTLHQRDSMRKLREELAARSSNGETGLTIKFIKGVPRIVKNAEVSNSKPQNFLIST
ncbi:hypothetical protein QTP88_011708 [Uroleucon formosanum]